MACFSSSAVSILSLCLVHAAQILFLCLVHAAQCHGLLTRRIQPAVVSDSVSGCETVCSRRTSRDVSPRKETEFTFLSRRSFQLDDNNSRIVAVVAAIVGVLAVCGILSIVLWYRRRLLVTWSSKEESTQWEDFPPVSARYPAPSPHIYAERLASAGRSTMSLAAISSPPKLTIATNGAPSAGNSKQTRVPPPRLSRLPSLAWPLPR